MKLKIIARNYQWECGDGCCSESRRAYELMDDDDKFCIHEDYIDPMDNKEDFIYEQLHKNNPILLEAIKERLKDEMEIPDNITLVGVLELVGFEYLYTTDEWDNY